MLQYKPIICLSVDSLVMWVKPRNHTLLADRQVFGGGRWGAWHQVWRMNSCSISGAISRSQSPTMSTGRMFQSLVLAFPEKRNIVTLIRHIIQDLVTWPLAMEWSDNPMAYASQREYRNTPHPDDGQSSTANLIVVSSWDIFCGAMQGAKIWIDTVLTIQIHWSLAGTWNGWCWFSPPWVHGAYLHPRQAYVLL